MIKGYTGRVLRVDLTSGQIEIERPDEDFYRTYLGGSLMNLYYLMTEVPAGADPLGPDNLLCLSVGPAAGLALAGQSRMAATAKSPLTGGAGDAQAGGNWPAALKRSGFDAVIIKGRADKPVYLVLENGRGELRDAAELWGLETLEADRLIRKQLGRERLQTLMIGPGGENLVRFAALMSSVNRAAGRNGLGAVMGSKQLKAVVALGGEKPEPADREAIKALAAWGADNLGGSMVAGMGKFGTSGGVNGNQAAGGLPTRNYTSGVFEGWKGISAQALYNTALRGAAEERQMELGRDTCFGCPVRCKPVVELAEPWPVDPAYGGPEYETLASLGSYVGNDDLNVVCKANELCNRYGLDTISCGGVIAWAMEAAEAGLIDSDLAEGLDLKFGSGPAILELIDRIAHRQGRLGQLLAEGSARAADALGGGHQFLTTVKGQEAPAHMPQVKASLGLIYAVNPFGADHMSSEHDPIYEEGGYEPFRGRLGALGLTDPQPRLSLTPEKIRFARETQKAAALIDSLSLCQFVWGPAWQLYGLKKTVDLVRAATGWEVDLNELMAAGERRINLMRAFNDREGLTAQDDRLPVKFYGQPLADGPSDGFRVDQQRMEEAIGEYYRQAGWEADTGRPTRPTMDRLGLGWAAEMAGW